MTLATRIADLRIIAQMARGLPVRGNAAGQLAAFYGPQAQDYDRFREQLLQGRAELIEAMRFQPGDRVIEYGAGTGRMVDFYRDRLDALTRVDLVDLCEPLLECARARLDGHPKVAVHHANACHWQPSEPVQQVYFSYALSMIPPWFEAIDNAWRALAPGGQIGVVDFQVAPRGGSQRGFQQGRLARHLWPMWFDHDGVRLDPDILAYLQYRFEPVDVRELRAKIPYMFGLRVPYFVFVGRKRAQEALP
jgi:S-adenosylmethionine-diacylgycerolhomoserine-N-methlytransferase